MKNSKNALGSYLALIFVVLSIASMISYFILSKDGEKSPAIVYIMTILAIVAQCAVFVFNRTETGKVYNTSSLIAAALSAYALEQLMMGRIEWLGGLAAHNASLAPMHPSFMVTVVLFVVTILVAIAAAFCKQVKE